MSNRPVTSLIKNLMVANGFALVAAIGMAAIGGSKAAANPTDYINLSARTIDSVVQHVNTNDIMGRAKGHRIITADSDAGVSIIRQAIDNNVSFSVKVAKPSDLQTLKDEQKSLSAINVGQLSPARQQAVMASVTEGQAALKSKVLAMNQFKMK